jgi:hypothetical protein
MSCDIANGRLEQCKDSISGLQAIYFINYGSFDPDPSPAGDVTYSLTPGLEDLITGISAVGLTDIYKYELKGANGFDTAIQTSRDNGTTFFEQTLTVQFKRQDAVTHKNIKMLAYGRPQIVVRTNGNQFFLAGLFRGMDASAGTISSGTALGDFNGYGLTFMGQEETPANFLDCTTEAGLATLLGGVTIVDN